MTNDDKWKLGRFVRVRQRVDGTHRAFLSVPAALRPVGWAPNITLPESGSQAGSLLNAKFRARVESDARFLNARLDLRRERDAIASSSDKSLPRLAEIYFNRDNFKSLSAARQYRNRRNVGKILEWSAARGHPDVASLSEMDVDDFLARYSDRPSTKFDMRCSWNMLFTTALYARWLKESPLKKGGWETPKPKPVAVWTIEDVQKYAKMSREMKQPGLAALIITMMSIGQRLGDLREAQWGRQYFGDQFIIQQSKTGVVVKIPVPQEIRDLIESVRIEGSPFVFNNFDTGTGFTAANIAARFCEVRHAVCTVGDKKLQLRGLRHACVCQLMAAGVNTPQIAAITGHLLARVHSILERYYPDRVGFAETGMRRAFEANGGDPEAFGNVAAMPALDWIAGHDSSPRYERPLYTERNVERLWAAKTGQHRFGATLPQMQPSDGSGKFLVQQP